MKYFSTYLNKNKSFNDIFLNLIFHLSKKSFKNP
jgi:hypothetical protein